MNTITLETQLQVIGPYQDEAGRIRAMTYAQQVEWARSLGARLPTTDEFDAMWDQADIQHTVVPRNVMTAPLDALHDEIVGQLDKGLVVAAKTWVDDGTGRPCNYGMLVPPEEVKKGLWRGLKVYLTSVSAYAIQPPGHAHGEHHADWSQLGYCVREVVTGDVVKAIFELDPSSSPGPPPFTSRGDKGDAVRQMQRWLTSKGYPLTIDGDHGPLTDAALSAWRKDQMPDTDPSPNADPLACRFIQARHYTRANRKRDDIWWIVLHSTEGKIVDGAAQAVARWFSGPPAPRASAHYIVDAQEIVQGVSVCDVAWAAPGANRHGIQIEQVGRAMKTDWEGEGWPVLQRSARLVASLCGQYGIPVVFVDASGLKGQYHGITTHYQVNKAFKRSDHCDPGGPGDKCFPLERYLEAVRDAL